MRLVTQTASRALSESRQQVRICCSAGSTRVLVTGAVVVDAKATDQQQRTRVLFVPLTHRNLSQISETSCSTEFGGTVNCAPTVSTGLR